MAEIAHKLFEKHPCMLIQHCNMWRPPKITKAFLTAMKIAFLTLFSSRNNKTLMLYGLDTDNRLHECRE